MPTDCAEDASDLFDECLLCGDPLCGDDRLHAHCETCLDHGDACCDATEAESPCHNPML